MHRQGFNRFISQALKTDLLVGFVAYWLQHVDERFAWLFFGAVIVLVWLGVAWTGSLLEYLVEGEKAAIVEVRTETDFTAKYAGRHKTVPATEAAANLVRGIEGIGPAQTGRFFDYAGKEIPW